MLYPLPLLVWIASLVQGTRISWRRSATWYSGLLRAGGGVLGSVLVIAAVFSPLLPGPPERVRIVKAQADVRALGSAVAIYAAHMGRLPERLEDLTRPATNAKGETTAIPFMSKIPKPPRGWTGYHYVTTPDGRFAVCATGEGLRTESPDTGGPPCP